MEPIDLTAYELSDVAVELPPYDEILQAVNEFRYAIDTGPEDDEAILRFSIDGKMNDWVIQEVVFDSSGHLIIALEVEDYLVVIATPNRQPTLVVAYEIPHLYDLTGDQHELQLLGPRGPYLRRFVFSSEQS